MKLDRPTLRHFIQEAIENLVNEETMEQQRNNAITQISNILMRLEQTNINAQDVLNAAKEAYEAALPKDETAMGMSMGNRKEKKWSDADHDKQEKIAKEIEKEDPGISKEKKMAFAGAQVNREKRKRKK